MTGPEPWPPLVTVALLGTDRRPPPPLDGPLSAVVLEQACADPAEVLLTQVAVAAVVQRAGLRPAPLVRSLQPPAADPRPVCPTAAIEVLRRVQHGFPEAEGEWVELAGRHGWRLPPELAPDMLRRHRTDARLRPLVEALIGPLTPWLVDHLPVLAAGRLQTRAPAPLPPALERLVTADAASLCGALDDLLRRGALGPAQRHLLPLVVVRVSPAVLLPVARHLRRLADQQSAFGSAHVLADLFELRHAVHTSLRPVDAPPTTSPETP
jgi:hypothetical protein